MLELLMLSLAVFYVAYVVTSSAGPFKLFQAARAKLPHGGLLTCFICLAFWAALALSAAVYGQVVLVPSFAAAGAAVILYHRAL